MQKQDTTERDRLLLYAGIGTAGYFFVVKPLLKKIGIDPADRYIDINTPEDWERAEKMYTELHKEKA